MENVLVDRSAGDHEFRRSAGAGGGGCRRLALTSPVTLPRGASGCTSFPYHSSAPPFHPPYAAYHHNLCSSHSLPLLPSHHPALLPRPPLSAAVARHATFPYRPVTLPPPPPLPPVGASAAAKVKQTTATGMTSVPAARKVGEYKRKKPRTPRSTEESPAARRRKPLQRAAPLPAAMAVTEALDNLEREVTRGFVEDLLHALAPPPSSLPLPTFSLVRAATGAKAAAPSCAV